VRIGRSSTHRRRVPQRRDLTASKLVVVYARRERSRRRQFLITPTRQGFIMFNHIKRFVSDDRGLETVGTPSSPA
jgi:hypothetical protein